MDGEGIRMLKGGLCGAQLEFSEMSRKSSLRFEVLTFCGGQYWLCGVEGVSEVRRKDL